MGYLVVDCVHEKRHWFLTKRGLKNWIRYDVLSIMDTCGMHRGYVIIKHNGKIRLNRFEA